MRKKSIQLTSAEETIMRILWKLEKGLIRDILEQVPAPKPAYNTVSTVVRVLEKKKFVSHKSAEGNSHIYFPLISETEYKSYAVNNLFSKYFDGSITNVLSFFAEKNNISAEEFKDLQSLVNDLKNKRV
jgi:predicted transcriptional regulator